MTEQKIYQLKQIVWAKIDSYPWWPGKVTETIFLNRKKVYKINFFGDPTYCHLFSEALYPFCQQPPSYEKFRLSDLKLRKAVQMAKKFIAKNQVKILQESDDDVSPVEKIMHQPSAFQETKLQSKHEIDITQKMLDNEPLFQRQTESIPIHQLLQAEVNESNIIEVLNSKIVSELTKQKGYSSRKLGFSFIEKLKNALLNRYNLNNIGNFNLKMKNKSSNQKVSTEQQKIQEQNNVFQQNKIKKQQRIFKLHRLRKHHKSHKAHNHSNKTLCIRKIYTILKKRNFTNIEAKGLSIKMIDNLLNKQKNNNDTSELFKKSFIDMINQIKNSSQVQMVQYIKENRLQIV